MKIAKIMFIIILLVSPCYPQELGTPLTISRTVGDTLMPAERARLSLFPEVRGFKWAVFFLADDSTVNAKVHFGKSEQEARDSSVMGYGTLRSVHLRLARDSAACNDSAKVLLADGTLLIATVYGETRDKLYLETARFGQIAIAKNQVETIGWYNGTPAQGYFKLVTDPNETRAFVMPTATTPQAGKGYVADYELIFFTAAIGVTDWLMINGGTLLIPVRPENMIFNYGVKVRLYESPERFGVAAGVQMLNNFGFSGNAGIAYTVASYGDKDSRVNLAVGRAFESGGGSSMLYGISGDGRVSESIKLVAELWIMEHASWSPIVVGVRFFGSRLSADLGLLYPLGESLNSPIGIPVASLTYTF